MCFLWILEQTAIYFSTLCYLTGFYNRESICLLRGTNSVFTQIIQVNFRVRELRMCQCQVLEEPTYNTFLYRPLIKFYLQKYWAAELM